MAALANTVVTWPGAARIATRRCGNSVGKDDITVHMLAEAWSERRTEVNRVADGNGSTAGEEKQTTGDYRHQTETRKAAGTWPSEA